MAGTSKADYTVTIRFQSFTIPPFETLITTQSCCVPDPIPGSGCSFSCNSTLLVCIRTADQPLNDNSCPLGQILAPADPNITEITGTFRGRWEVCHLSVLLTRRLLATTSYCFLGNCSVLYLHLPLRSKHYYRGDRSSHHQPP